jgi:hypothetical protein
MKSSNSAHLIIALIICLLAIFIGYILFANALGKDEKALASKLEELFEGKIAVTDGQHIIPTGEMSNNRRNFTLNSGGFKIYELTKESNGFVKSEIVAGDLQYLEDEYYNLYGFRYDNYRSNVNSCYYSAFETIVQGNENNRKLSYSPNKYVDIKNFPEGYSTVFFSIEMADHPTESYRSKSSGGNVSNNKWKVDFFETKEYFTVVEKKEEKNKALMKYLAASFGIGLLISLLVKPLAKVLQPNPKVSNSVFGKKWKSVNRNFIISFESGMRGNNKAIVVENGKIKKGTMKFTENGKNMNISLSDTEYYFQIDKLTDTTLEVLDLASEKVEQFEVLGSGALTKPQIEIGISDDKHDKDDQNEPDTNQNG